MHKQKLIHPMKKILFIPFLFISLLCTRCNQEDTEELPGETLPIEIILQDSLLFLFPGDTLTLTATLIPEPAAPVALSWHSSDEETATVENGKVTALNPGETLITVSWETALASCRIKVPEEPFAITSLAFDADTLYMTPGETLRPALAIEPGYAPPDSIRWKSAAPATVFVDKGILTAISYGKTTITAFYKDTEATCLVIVPEPVIITGIQISPDPVEIETGEEYILTVNITPSHASPDFLIWKSSNEKVATVENGILKGKGYGEAVITAFSEETEASCEVQVKAPERTYRLIWSDEFEGTTLNENYWNYETGGAGWGNQEEQYYIDRSDNVRMENGYLIIEARKETYFNNQYTSGRIHTKDKVFFTYGKVEAHISLPEGKGTWPAFWMMPNTGSYGGWPRSGEIDIMEHVGHTPQEISHAIHTQQAHGDNCWVYWSNFGKVENTFRTYTVEWIENYYNGNDALIFSVDGNRTATKIQDNYPYSTSNDWPFDKDFYLVLNLALGGNLGKEIDDNMFNRPVQMKVDWVRVYQQQEE
ncbi:MAG: family 16 glycosylhydrolase [Candidatus Azobacteroides sp.]|nr:family 16 glycosylhydrolase [Candidatus Azobacteroides sp.]